MTGDPPHWERSLQLPTSRGMVDISKAGPPQAFISYAWESETHKIWVRDLAKRLWANCVRTILDEWDLVPGGDRIAFMERSIENCDFVIVVCTPSYAEKANRREGGVGYESMVITAALAEQIDSRKFIPVLRSGEWNSSLPNYLKSKAGVDLRGISFSEEEYEKLLRALHCAPLQPPPLGPKPRFALESAAISRPQALTPRSIRDDKGTQPNLLNWSSSDPGACIDVTVTNSREVIEAGQAIGLEYPKPLRMKALIDSGAAVTVISKTFAKYCKLLQTGETEIRTLGGIQKCGEHAGAISFPNTSLRSIDPIRIVSADFIKEQYYACLIGRDVLRNWKTTFDGHSNCVTITDRFDS